eukprot:GILI01014595.1.p1 GENE.GILI01014595.1~~GILI01014595.1.p1  ORF type:complete len:507 (-),score=123.82 GILI01014595.1:150-1670(-)
MSQLEELEKVSRTLDPTPEERSELFTSVNSYLENFLTTLNDVRPFNFVSQSDLKTLPFQEQPKPIGDVLSHFDTNVNTPGLHVGSARDLAYLPGGGLYVSSLGDYIAACTNKYSSTDFTAPGAVLLESQVIEWVRSLIGYPETAGGTLTGGASFSNLTALATARKAKDIRAADFARAVIYTTHHTHHSIHKCLVVCGMDECVNRVVPVDPATLQMDPAQLDLLIEADLAAGLRPWCVVATGGTADAGTVDDFNKLADVTERHNIWLHIDAAYGGFFQLCEQGRRLFAGACRSDSIVMDAHKSLFLPYGSGVLMVRDLKYLRATHASRASYMIDTYKFETRVSPCDLTVELSRHYRVVRIWLPLQVHGLSAIRKTQEEKCELARHFYKLVLDIPNIECLSPPHLTVICFRYTGPLPDKYHNTSDVPSLCTAAEVSGEEAKKLNAYNKFNDDLVTAIQKDGRIFITATEVDGVYWARLCVMCVRTHKEQVELAAETIRSLVGHLVSSS